MLLRKIIYQVKACFGVSAEISHDFEACYVYFLSGLIKELGYVVPIPMSDLGVRLAYCDLCGFGIFRIKSHSYLLRS